MASEEVQGQFRERGVQIIPPIAGRRCFVEELLRGRKGDVEVILGDAPYGVTSSASGEGEGLPLIGGHDAVVHSAGGLEVACVLDPAAHRYLSDHRLDGKPVFPAAMAMELMAEVARAGTEAAGAGIEVCALEVLNGIVLDGDKPLEIRVSGCRAANSAALNLRIVSPRTPSRAHYRAEVSFGVRSVPPAVQPPAPASLEAFPLSVPEVYRQWLFQGPCFAGITAIDGIRSDAIVGALHSVPPAMCLSPAPSGAWLIDPTVVDASLQLVILWARHWHDKTPLPMRIGRFRLFGSLSGQPIRCWITAKLDEGGDALAADIHYADMQGRPLAVMEGLQCACTQALNRLSERAERGMGEPGKEKHLEVIG
jgi:hypothetical protein